MTPTPEIHPCRECGTPLPHTEPRDEFGNCFCFLLCEGCARRGRDSRLAAIAPRAVQTSADRQEASA